MEVIIDGIRYLPAGRVIEPWQDRFEVLQHGYIKSNDGEPAKEYIYSVRKKSDNTIFTIGDTLALSWYQTFITPHIIKEFVIKDDGGIYARYDETSMWELSNVRKVTDREIAKAIQNHCELQNKK